MKTQRLQLSMLLMLFVFLGFNTVKAQNTMVINNTTALPSSVVEIQMAINNADPFVAFQLDIPLPAGFTYVNASLALVPARITNHVISGNVVAGNVLRIVSHSPNNSAFLGSSGTIMTFQVNAPAATGGYTFNIVDGYISSAAGTNIISGTTAGTITIAKGTPTVSPWPTATAITYGAQLSTATLSGGAATYDAVAVPGTFAYINPTVVPNAGTYVAAVRFTPTNTTLYNTVDGTINVTVNQRAVTITADAKTKVYGNTDPALTYLVTSGSLVAGDSWTGALTRVAGENIGAFAINQGTVNVTPTPGNYNITYVSANLTITSRPITVNAEAKTKVYGNADPALTYVSSGLIGGDAITGELTREPGEDVDVYLILQGTIDAGGNYTINYTGANFTITKRNLNIIADDIFKIAGNEYVFLGSEFTTGTLYFTDEVTSVTLTSTGAEAAAAPGTYPIIPSNAVGSADLADNYNINYVNGTMTVTDKIGLTIDGLTAHNKEYDGNNDAEVDNFGVLVGVEVGDDVTLVTDAVVATFADINVNDDIIVSVVGLTLGGADADKYILAPTQYASANIYAKELTIGGTFAVENKEYDGTTDAVIIDNDLELVGVIGIDDVVLTGVVAEFATSVPGDDILVSIVFANIAGADISNYTLTLTGAPTSTANITPLAGQNEVIVVINPAGAGSVSGAGYYYEDANVALEATANSGYVFLNWEVDGTVVETSTTYIFTMPAEDVTVTANFEEVLYNVTIEISPVGAGTATGAGQYAANAAVTVVATANTGYTFIGWELNSSIVETNATYTFTMPTENVGLVAVFEINVHTLTLVANPAAGGTVSGGGNYAFNASVPVVATPAEGYNFVNWTIGATVVSTSANFNYTMPNSNVTLTANFEVIPDPTYTLTVVADPVAGGTATGGGEFEAGVEVTVNATANANFTFDGWYLGGSLVSTDAEFTFNMPAENITLVAKFGTVSINDPSMFSISVYPNPSRGNINITSDRIITDVKVFDMIGKVVYSTQPDAEVIDLMLSVEPGMYFVRIYTENGQKTIKLQIAK
ncbi:MAG: InlB B-repeat-containing protein [Bacteroidetes bacterium]|nr:InlB B-repeat-containing protein [Bacteroidota bacterium]